MKYGKIRNDTTVLSGIIQGGSLMYSESRYFRHKVLYKISALALCFMMILGSMPSMTALAVSPIDNGILAGKTETERFLELGETFYNQKAREDKQRDRPARGEEVRHSQSHGILQKDKGEDQIDHL